MIINVEGPCLISIPDMQKVFESKAVRYLDILKYQNSLEWQNWDKYLKTQFKVSLYDSIRYLLDCSKLSKTEKGYMINIINSPITRKLNTESLAKLLMSGNLSIRKSNILSNIIKYSIE